MDNDTYVECATCGQDVWLPVALWHECEDGWHVSLCSECDAENPTGDCPND